MLNWIFKLCLGIALFLTPPAQAREYIELFNSDITVNKDGSLSIIENITLHHEGIEFRRGIIRDLSTKKGEVYTISTVLRNNQYEPWFINKTPYSIELNTGDDTLLPTPGISTYTISYKLDYALRPINKSDYNELYLNITGSWPIPMDKVKVTVHYPENTEIISQYGYQGNQPAKEFPRGSMFEFEDLLPNQEITIGQAFSKGTVSIPLPKVWKILISGYFIMLLYYILAWYFWGKDPKPQPIVPQWEIPQNLSPLQCAYINNNGSEPKNSFFLHILWLINKRILKVIENDAPAFLGHKKIYTLTMIDESEKDHPEIKQYCKAYPNILTLTDTPNENLANYVQKLNKKTRATLEHVYYFKRTFITMMGAVIMPIFSAIAYPEEIEHIFQIAYLLLFILPTLLSSRFLLTFISLLAGLPILVAIGITSPLLLETFAAYIITIFIFNKLLFQPTTWGQRQKEKIDGIKMFLRTLTNNKSLKINDDISKDGLSMKNRVTPLDMENLFPYAVALGLEKEWSNKFATMFGNAALAQSVNNHPHFRSNLRNNLNSYCKSATFLTQKSSLSSSGAGSFGGGRAGGGFGGGGGRGR